MAPKAKAAQPAETVEVVVLVQVSGLRDGERWPAVGESWTLPTAEAEQYIRQGLVEAV